MVSKTPQEALISNRPSDNAATAFTEGFFFTLKPFQSKAQLNA